MARPAIFHVRSTWLGGAAASALLCVVIAHDASGQADGDASPGPAELLKQPVSALHPGGITVDTDIKNPLADDPQAAQRGMELFNSMNCVGCHAPNGAGGMGPALSNSKFIYGGEPAEIFLTISQGRPNGMPAWGATLPDESIWQLVSYVQAISDEPASETWGSTVSRTPQMPKIEQVPAEYQTTTTPWKYTQPFSGGKAPFAQPAGQ